MYHQKFKKECDDKIIYVSSIDMYNKKGWKCSSKEKVRCFTYGGKSIDCGILEHASYSMNVFKCKKLE